MPSLSASPLPLSIHTAAQVRAIDRHAIEHLKIPSYSLMTRAGEAAHAALRSHWPAARRIAVVCGPGNNGGDGYVLARLAKQGGNDVTAIPVGDPGSLRGDAARAHGDFIAAGGVVQPWRNHCLQHADVIVDAIFGTGLSRPIEPAIAATINSMNERGGQGVPILALDIPSGLHADTGEVLGAAVRAQRTLTFVGLKLGFYLGEGPDHAGVIAFDGLGLPASATARVDTAATRIGESLLAQLLPPRPRTAHKGQNGHVLVIGGGAGMAGAARMAGEAALRAGAGLVTVATREQNVAAIIAGRPELICHGIERSEHLGALIDRADVLALGPGLGRDSWAQRMLDAALAADKPVVIDADALNLLAQQPRAGARWILTPHPGEAARLLGTNAAAIQRDRLGSARAIAQRYLAHVVLKGAGTLVAAKDALPAICDRGNPGMASPGMGDVLTGVIAGIAAQTGDLAGSACAGVLAHAMAGDLAARGGERGLIATDLLARLPTCVNPARRS